MQSPTALLTAPVGRSGIVLNRLVSRAGASIVISQVRDPPPALRERGGGKVSHRKECCMEWGGVRAARAQAADCRAGWKGLVRKRGLEGLGQEEGAGRAWSLRKRKRGLALSGSVARKGLGAICPAPVCVCVAARSALGPREGHGLG